LYLCSLVLLHLGPCAGCVWLVRRQYLDAADLGSGDAGFGLAVLQEQASALLRHLSKATAAKRRLMENGPKTWINPKLWGRSSYAQIIGKYAGLGPRGNWASSA